MFRRRAILALALACAAAGGARAQEPRVVEMGTGSIAGVYFPVGIALCRLVNVSRAEHGIRCAARLTEGSVANIEALRAGEIDLAIVQSDVQHAAATGEDGFAGAGPWSGLRSVMSLYPEALTIVARADAGIAALGDLAGRSVAIGAPGSGQRQMMDDLIAAAGWTPDIFAETPELPSTALADALCSGRIDAFALVVGHPALALQEATNACDTVLVAVDGPAPAALVAENPFYAEAVIPGGLYRGAPRDVPTFGVRATLVTRDDVPDDVIGTLVRSVFGDLDTLRGLNAVLADVAPEDMAEAGLTAPRHPAAAAFYRESGWID
jgi:TRAP transporter TAXI family solute receptor